MSVQNKTYKAGTFGACAYAKASPLQLADGTPVLNVVLSFEEALKLNLAIDEGVRWIGRHNRATSLGKSVGLKVSIHLDKRRVTVQMGKVGPTTPQRSGGKR